MKRLKKSNSNYGTVDTRSSLPNVNLLSNIDVVDSDLEQDPVANNYDVSDFLNSDNLNEVDLDADNSHVRSFHKTSTSTYVIEPVAFLQNLATSIMTISSGQFVYQRIYDRLVKEHMNDGHHNHTNLTVFFGQKPADCIRNVSSNETLIKIFNSVGNFKGDFFYNNLPMQPSTHSALYNFHRPPTSPIVPPFSPTELNEIRNKAQSQTAHLYFLCALYSAIPVILMTNILGVNCSVLGRKTLLVINFITLTIRYFIFLLQSIFTEWPDWVFYVGSFIENLSGSQGIFYLALYCFISDLTPASDRSYRITLVNNINSIASLCVTGACGYVIKYYGYFYLFLTSTLLTIFVLFYTILFVSEPLEELRAVSIWTRISQCSIKKSANCFRVYFNDYESNPNASNDEQEDLLPKEANETSINIPTKQTGVLLLVVFTNFVYVFGTQGIQAIFTLFIMNAPYCFDSVDISTFTIFTTVVSLFACLFVSKFIKVNDILICAASCFSFFASIFCYILGNSTFYIYLGSVIASICGLQYGYARSIVSKSMAKHEVSDALSLIIIVDTIVSVVSLVIFPVFYSAIVSQGVDLIFLFANGFVLLSLCLNIINYFFYKPPVHHKIGLDTQNDSDSGFSVPIGNTMINSFMVKSVDTI